MWNINIFKFCIFVIITAYYVGAVGGHECFVRKDNGQFKHENFDPTTELCCGSRIIQKDYYRTECCGGMAYDDHIKICCGDRLYPSMTENGMNQECCGNRTFIADGRSYCCGDTNLHSSTDDGEGCCGTEKKQRDEECCRDKYDNTSIHRLLPDHQCCGVLYYDTRRNDCAKENYLVEKGYDLCGVVKYNTEHQSCCDGTINDGPMGSDDNCCGTRKYSTTEERCCSPEDSSVISIDKFCCGSVSMETNQRCCNDSVMNATSTTQECCGAVLHDPANGERCCLKGGRGHTYNIASQKCCKSDSAASVANLNDGCCGHHSYNTETSVCCNDSYVISKQQSSHDSCCASKDQMDGKSYGSSYQRCAMIDGLDTPIILNKTRHLCGGKPHDRDRDLCCNSVLYSNAMSLGLECCLPGKYTYDPVDQICCNSAVYNKEERQSCDYDVDDEEYTDYDDEEEEDEYTDNDGDPFDDETTDICDICSKDESQFLQDLKNGKIDVCHNNAQKFKVRKERRVQQTNQYKLLGKTQRNFYTDVKKTKTQHVYLPCSCRIYHSQVIVVTDKPARKRKLVLDENDIVLPFSRAIRTQLKKIHKKNCKEKIVVKELLSDLKVYLQQLQVKVHKLEKKVINNS